MPKTRRFHLSLTLWLSLLLPLLLSGACVPPAASDAGAAQTFDLRQFMVGPLGTVVVGPGEDIHIRSMAVLTSVGDLGSSMQRAVTMAVADYGPIKGHNVNLGAGLDSRAYRVPGAAHARFFEVDHPSVLEVKKARLQRHLGDLPPHVRFVPLDFETLDLAAALAASGFDRGTRTLFLWEGVSQYVSREALHDTLRFVGRSAPGSRLAFSYVLQRFIDDRSAFPELSEVWDATCGGDDPLWKSGLHPADVADTLSGFSLRICEEVGASEHVARYLEPRGRGLGVSEIERIVLAEVEAPPAST